MVKNQKIATLKKEIRSLSHMIQIYKRESPNIKTVDDAINSYFVYNQQAPVEFLIKYCNLYGYDQNVIRQKIWQMIDNDELYITNEHCIGRNNWPKVMNG